MRKSIWLWSTLILLPLPIAYFSLRSSDPAPRLVGAPLGSQNRGPANYGGRSALQWGKVEIDASKLAVGGTPATNLSGVTAMKLAQSGTVITRGTRLFAVINNECLDRFIRQRSSGIMKAIPPTVSEEAYDNAEKEEVEGLATQAYSFEVEADLSLSQVVSSAEDDPCLEHLSEERKVRLALPTRSPSGAPTDPSTNLQLHLANIKAPQAYDLFYSSSRAISKDTVVAVVDSGIDYNHEDLAANIWRSGDGRPGYDFVNGDASPLDDLGHGTHVAGLIGAVVDNGKGGSGVIGKKVKLMAVKVIGADNEGSMSDYINGLRYAADNGAEIINLSLGGSETSRAEEEALRYAIGRGAIIVTAAGNDGKELTATSNDYPAGYSPTIAGIVTVGSVDTINNEISEFSNYSPTYVFIGAPGAEDSVASRGLYSTVPQNLYDRYQGTSMSTPVVAGAAALVLGVAKSEGLSLTSAQVIDLILGSARIESSLTTKFKSGRILDLERLARAVKWKLLVDSDGGTEDAQ